MNAEGAGPGTSDAHAGTRASERGCGRECRRAVQAEGGVITA
jgi:hypothetical protein